MIDCIYYTATGVIQGSGTYVDLTDAELSTPVNCLFMQGVVSDPYSQYIDTTTKEIHTKQVNPSMLSALTLSADSVDSIIISDIPNPSIITVDQDSYTVTDGEFEFSTPLKGVYSITIESFPYLPKEYEVTAV